MALGLCGRVLFVTLLGVTLVAGLAPAVLAQPDRWAEAMAAFERQDGAAPPPAGGIIFVGSSSIRRWNLQDSFPDLPVINRGFGGSELSDSVEHIDLLVIKHKPRTVVLYAGDNDLARGKTPRQVADDFRSFTKKIHTALPQTRVAFIGIKPSILRWEIVEKVREANALIRDYCRTDDRLGYIDVDGPMLGWDEKPRKAFFVEDGLHLTPKGYAVWAALVRPFLE